MNEPTLAALIQHLDRLELGNRRWKRAAAAVALGIAAAVLMGQARTAGRVVEAEEFILRDASGKLRARLGLFADDTVALHLYDRDAKVHAELGVRADGSMSIFNLNDRGGNARAQLDIRNDGAPGLRLTDKDGETRVALLVEANDQPWLGLLGKHGKDRVTLRVLDNGSVVLLLTHFDGGGGAALGVGIDGRGSIILSDKAGKIIWRAP